VNHSAVGLARLTAITTLFANENQASESISDESKKVCQRASLTLYASFEQQYMLNSFQFPQALSAAYAVELSDQEEDSA
jgi:hypothetical protein